MHQKFKFDFEIDDLFFDSLEYSDIKKGSLKAKVYLNKKSTFLELDFKIDGYVELICDRCLDEYKQPVSYEGKLYVKFSEKEDELADDVICLLPTDHELDISHYDAFGGIIDLSKSSNISFARSKFLICER